jgi:hypothetical protein
MTDKVQKIREEVVRMHNLLPIMDGDNISVNYADRICRTLEMYIDSLQEEPISEDFEKALAEEWQGYVDRGAATIDVLEDNTQELAFAKGFYRGANWQKEQLTAKTVDVTIAIPYPNGDGGYTQLVDSKEALPFGDNIKVLVIKEE